MKECVVCAKENANYRCPLCRERYCSVVCCSTHKLSCANLEKQDKQEPNQRTDRNEGQGERKGEERTEGESVEEVKGNKSSQSERILTDFEKQKLRNSELIKSQLRSKRLVSDLMKIDSAEDRQDELKRARINPEFEQFVNTLLTILKEEPVN
jgi:hypothetical protein